MFPMEYYRIIFVVIKYCEVVITIHPRNQVNYLNYNCNKRVALTSL